LSYFILPFPQQITFSMNSNQWIESIDISIIRATTQQRTKYTIQVYNKVSKTFLRVEKYYTDFEHLRNATCENLDHGHFCNAACPWFWMHIQHQFPRKSLMHGKHPRVIATRQKMFEKMLQEIAAFIMAPESKMCKRASERVPEVFMSFLFGDHNQVDSGLFATSPTSTTKSARGGMRKTTSPQACSEYLDESCTLCCQSLVPSCRKSVSSTSTVDSEEDEEQSLTTLVCGHVFHDECIVKELNIRLECPTCHHTM